MENNTKTVLVVDDEVKFLDVLKSFLESKGFLVVTAQDGKQALEIFSRTEISLVLLDLMLPQMSGEEVCMKLRTQSRVPIIMLTAKAEEADMLEGLNIGADDYVTKPFSFKTLYARMDAVLRRSGSEPAPLFNKLSFNHGELEIDFENRVVKKNKTEIRLTPYEFKILEALAKYPNRVFTRDDLILYAFEHTFDGYDRTIDTHIKNIRHKIESDPKKPVYIQTLYGVGYKFGNG